MVISLRVNHQCESIAVSARAICSSINLRVSPAQWIEVDLEENYVDTIFYSIDPDWASYHRIYTGADAHVRSHRGSEVIVGPTLETALQYESALAIGHRELVDEVLDVNGDFKNTLPILKTWNGLLPWHPAPYF